VFFPGNTPVNFFTILIPLRVSGQVELGDTRVDESHYYHILNYTVLRLMKGSRLEAIAICNIKE
jgi:hypothetical protein